jgi:hypothetical protein
MGRIATTIETVVSNESPEKSATRTTSFEYGSLGEVINIRETTMTGGIDIDETTVTDIRHDDEGRVTGYKYTDETGEYTVTDITYDDDGRVTGYRQTVTRDGSTLEYICGDGICSLPWERLSSCPVDCAICGDGTCSFPFEDYGGCSVDCGRHGDSRQE